MHGMASEKRVIFSGNTGNNYNIQIEGLKLLFFSNIITK